MSPSVRRRVRAVVVGMMMVMLGGAVALMPGCSQLFEYDLRVVVRDVADGRPLSGVHVDIQGELVIDHDSSPPRSPEVTGDDGVFTSRCRAYDTAFRGEELPKWSIVLTKSGYEDEVLDISPSQRPDSGREKRRIVVYAYMRPQAR